MRVYIIKRLLLIIPTLFITTFVVFFLMRLVPGDAVDALVAEMGQFGGETLLGESRALVEQELGLDVPFFTQYGRWMGFLPDADGSFSGISQGDLGISLRTKNLASDAGNGLPRTMVELVATHICYPVC